MTCKRKYKQRRNYLLLFMMIFTSALLYLVVSTYTRRLHASTSGLRKLAYKSPELTRVPRILHLLWCGNRTFDFRHYISALAAVKFSRAYNVRFYCQNQPLLDHFEYNTWFHELLTSSSNMRIEKVHQRICKNENTKMKFIADLLLTNGGIFVGYNTILSRPLNLNDDFQGRLVSSYEGYATSVVGAKPLQTRSELLTCMDEKLYSAITPVSEDPGYFCAYSNMYPKDLLTQDVKKENKFYNLARRLFYKNDGTIPAAKSSSSRIVPNIAHQLWISLVPMDFLFYLSSLSLLNVVGVDRLYIYGERTPGGRYWRKLELDNRVTFITIPRPDTAYNRRTGDPRLASDIFRADIMVKYGGIYSDVDVIWTRRPPEHFWTYEASASLDWAHSFPPYPDYMNLGVSMACDPSFAKADFWKSYANSLKDLRDETFGYNGLLQPYKIYERNPASINLDDRLQVMCFKRRCYPRWGVVFENVNWSKDISAMHWTWPNPVEFIDMKSLYNSSGTWSDIGKYVIKRSNLTAQT